MNSNLFQTANFILNSGVPSTFKIECDALTDEDIETFALLISKNRYDLIRQENTNVLIT